MQSVNKDLPTPTLCQVLGHRDETNKSPALQTLRGFFGQGRAGPGMQMRKVTVVPRAEGTYRRGISSAEGPGEGVGFGPPQVMSQGDSGNSGRQK